MRKFALTAAALTLATATFTLAGASSAHAFFGEGRGQGAFCAQTLLTGDARICDFPTFASCLAYVSGMAGTCMQNPAYAKAYYDRDEPRPAHRARRH